MYDRIERELRAELEVMRNDGSYKEEVPITSPQGSRVSAGETGFINMCANNYLGLANHPKLIKSAHAALDRWGVGMASVRFICGTTTLHRKLEDVVSRFLATDDTILYSSCFDANGGLFEVITQADDVIISDELNHASIIDGVRLSKAQRLRYRNRNMADLEAHLIATSNARRRIIATDGVFSMDGLLAPLREICDLADKYNALVMVDDSHAVGLIGKHGAGTPELFGVQQRVDILTGTFGKALGGSAGGYTSGRKEIIQLLRQRSRPYLFSNALPPTIVAGTLAAIELVNESNELLERLRQNTGYFRHELISRGFQIPDSIHPIVPIMVGDATTANNMAERMLKRGIYVRPFCYPVVPKDKARIRTQVSASHERGELDYTIKAFTEVRSELEREALRT